MSLFETDLLESQIVDAAPGEWTQVDMINSFYDVAVTKAEHDQMVAEGSEPFWGWGGVDIVFRSWNSSAYDPVGNVMYFTGGGRTNYGGNEVYSFDFDTLEWSRVTDPSPLTVKDYDDPDVDGDSDYDVYLPENAPNSAHTYDGLVWNPATQTFWQTATYVGFDDVNANLDARNPSRKAVWELDPTTGEWTQHESTTNHRWGASTYIPDSEQIITFHNESANDVFAFLYDTDGTETALGQVIKEDGFSVSAATVAFTNPETSDVYIVSRAGEGIQKIDISGGTPVASKAADLPAVSDIGIDFAFDEAGFAYRPTDDKFYVWNGGKEVVVWDPGAGTFEVIWNENAPSAPPVDGEANNRNFEKWVYLEESDSFAGVMEGEVFHWTPGSNPADINEADVGNLRLDSQTTGTLGVFLPLESGEKDFDSTVQVEYRKVGDSGWLDGQDLLRMRTELNVAEQESPNGYAGGLMGLEADTAYEIRVTVDDPDGVQGSSVQTLTARTKAVPAADPADPRPVEVSSVAEFQQALDTAQPGDVILVGEGVYSLDSPLSISASGTADNPITIRGLDRDGVVIDAQNERGFFVKGDHVTIENLSILNTGDGIRFNDADNLTVRNTYIQVNDTGAGGQKGIVGFGDDTYIVDNVLEGPYDFGRIDDSGGERGINIGGHNVEVAHNTLYGFLDAIAAANDKSVGVAIHHNEIQWATDNGIELDHGLRNLWVHDNMVANTNDAISAQTVAGGPAYIVKNMIYNVGNSPMKVKPIYAEEPQGILFANNTIAKAGDAWTNSSGVPTQVTVVNNLFMNQGNNDLGDTLRNTSDHLLLEMDHNGWYTDGRFRLGLAEGDDISVASFAEFQSETPYADNSLLLEGQPVFANLEMDFDVNGFAVYRDPAAANFALDPNSPALDAGMVLANITDGYSGDAPDLGALQFGQTQPDYGARVSLVTLTAPLAADDNASSSNDQPVTVDVVQNDFDPNGDPLEVVSLTSPAHGSATIDQDGQITYTPNAGYVGEDSFTYTIQDPGGEQATGTVSVAVLGDNTPPSAGDDSFSAASGEAVEIAASTLLANDSDAEGDPLSITAVEAGTGGTVSLSGTTITFLVSEGFEGDAGFTYTLSDGRGGSATGNVAIQVTADGTIAGTDTRDVIDVSTAESGQAIDARGGHDDVIGSAHADEITGGTGQDKLTGGDGDDLFHVVGNGGIDAVSGGSGLDEIRGSTGDDVIGLRSMSGVEAIDAGDGYDVIRGAGSRSVLDFSSVNLTGVELIDGAGGHDILTGSTGQDVLRGGGGYDEIDGGGGVDMAIYDANYADYRLSQGDGRIEVEARVTGENDDKLYNVEILQFADGQWSDGSFTAGATGFGDVGDSGGDEETATLSASDDTLATREDTPVTFDPTSNDTLSASAVVASIQQPARGSAVLADDGRITYTPDPDYAGADSFSYTLNDDADQTSMATVTIDVSAVNDAPQTVDDTAATTEGAAVTVDVLANDSDVDGDPLTIAGVSGVTNANVQINDDGTLAYTPNAGSAGMHSFTYTVSDGAGGEGTGQVTVDVSASGPEGPTASWTGSATRDKVGFSWADEGYKIDPRGGWDSIKGSDFADWIRTSKDADDLKGAGGDDLFISVEQAASGFDAIDGGAGFDTLKGDANDNVIGVRSLSSVERIAGGEGADIVQGGSSRDRLDLSDVELVDIELIDTNGGHDIVTGSAGDDHYRGGAGWDSFDGHGGFDTVYFDGNFADYTVTGADGTFSVDAHATNERSDDLANVEALRFADGVYQDGEFTVVGVTTASEHLVYDGA